VYVFGDVSQDLTDTDAPPSLALGPDRRAVEIFTYAERSADARRDVVTNALRRMIDNGSCRACGRRPLTIGPKVQMAL
jgi:hypothetical protein